MNSTDVLDAVTF